MSWSRALGETDSGFEGGELSCGQRGDLNVGELSAFHASFLAFHAFIGGKPQKAELKYVIAPPAASF